MLVVDALVHEGRDQQRHADDQVPHQPEAADRARLDVGQLVDEAARAVEGEHGDDAGERPPASVDGASIAANSAA